MLVHMRLNVPRHLVEPVRDLLDDERVTNVSHLADASIKPRGDVFEFDVAREAASAFVESLDSLGLSRDGGILLTQALGEPFAAATRIEQAAAGDPDDAVIWRVVQEKAEQAASPTPSYLAFLMIATALAAIAVITDSAVLVVGAMVVGPEFAVVSAVCTGLALRRWKLAARSAWTLLWTFVAAILVIAVLAWIATRAGLMTSADITRARPETEFIWRPDIWSFIVALLAGAAGVLAMATDKTSAMVGVFISVTTVPAAGNLALGLAIVNPAEVKGSAAQLALNFAGMIVAGLVTLAAQRLAWRHVSTSTRQRSSERRLASGARR